LLIFAAHRAGASHKNLKALINRYHWLEDVPDPTAALQSFANSKVMQWASEARRLNALELREYVTARLLKPGIRTAVTRTVSNGSLVDISNWCPIL
jgi:hypothetical protein